MGIVEKQDFYSELEFWSKDIIDDVIEDALELKGLKDMFTKPQIGAIVWIAAYVSARMLMNYNDMDVTYSTIPKPGNSKKEK